MMNNFDVDKIKNVVLTDDAIQWVIDRGRPICATDFIGYLFELKYLYKSMKKLGGALDVFGGFMLYSMNEKKPTIKDKKAIKIYKRLIKDGFLKFDDKEDQPFPEFCSCTEIYISSDRATFIEQPLFVSVSRQKRDNGKDNGIQFPQTFMPRQEEIVFSLEEKKYKVL